MAEVTTELVTKFSFKGSLKPIRDFSVTMASGIFVVKEMIGALESIGSAFKELTIDTLLEVDALSQLSQQTGIAIGELQTMRNMAEIAGVGADAMTSSIEGLSTKIGEAAQKGSEDFARLGISVRDQMGNVKSSTQVLGEVRQRFKELGLSMAEQKSFAEALGMDSSMLSLLNKTNAEWAELINSANKFGKISKQEEKQINDTRAAWKELGVGMNRVQEEIALAFAPEIEMLTQMISDLIAENMDWIKSMAEGVVKVIKAVAQTIKRLSPILAALAGAFLVAKVVALGFAGVMGIIFSPVVLITGAVTALILIVDDLIVAFNGGQSAIRDFVQELTGFDIAQIPEAMIAGFMKLKDVFANVKKWFMDAFGFILKGVERLGDAVSGVFGDDVETNVTASRRVGRGAAAAAMATSNSVSQDININIATNDPAAAGDAVSNSLQREMEKAQTFNNRGGR